MITFGSCFAGIGGIDLGLERAGMICKWQIEIDSYCNKVLEKHWSDVKRYTDITKVDFTKIEKVDLICGGFPCQDLSHAGKRAGLSGERSGLFYEIIRAVCDLRPRYVLLENVPGLLILGMGTVLGELAAIGYDAEWESLPAAAFGAPHLRYRVFIVAYPATDRLRFYKNEERNNVKTGTNGETKAFSASRQVMADAFSKRWGDGSRGNHRQEKDNEISGKVFRGRGYTFNEANNNNRRFNQWDVEPNVGRVVDGIPAQVDRLRCLGNAVVPQVAEWIGKQIIKYDGLSI